MRLLSCLPVIVDYAYLCPTSDVRRSRRWYIFFLHTSPIPHLGPAEQPGFYLMPSVDTFILDETQTEPGYTEWQVDSEQELAELLAEIEDMTGLIPKEQHRLITRDATSFTCYDPAGNNVMVRLKLTQSH